jgi:C4-dicarboxylate-specific signal transduction histidine kinase
MPAAPDKTAPKTEIDLLAAGLIHEMRQPLMGVKAGLLLAASELGEPATGLESWQLLASQVKRLEEIFQTWQELVTRPDAPSVPFAVEPVVQRTLDLMAFRLKALGPGYGFLSEAGLPLALATPRALVHALVNLLANALDALEEVGSRRLEVRLLAPASPGGPLEVRVSDEGPGIAAEWADRIFDAGFTTKSHTKGSGLGLHLARRLMRGCGGDVVLVPGSDARRRPWAGAELAVVLPSLADEP